MEGNEMEKELNNVKVMLRSVLTSSKGGVPAHVLQRDYREATFESLPYQKFGYRNLDAFIESMPDVVKISRTPTGEIYHAVADESTAHIAKMVSKQRTTKKRKSLKPPRRRPAPRSAPFYSPWRSQQHIVLQPLRPWPGKRPPKKTSRSHGMDYEAQQSQPRPYGRTLPGQQHHHLTVHTDGGRRRVDFQGPARLLLETPNQKQTQSYSVNRFEQPPRFRKLQEQQTTTTDHPVKKASPPRGASSPSRPPKKTSPKTHVQPVDMAKIKDGKKYYDTLIEYCKSHHISDLKFETMPSRIGQVYCYASSTSINQRVYGSGDLFGSSVEAEFAACRTACVELGLLNESPVPTSGQNIISPDNHSDSNQAVRSRVKQILESKPNGLWSTRFPVIYKERFQEDPPGNLLELVKAWKDLSRVEFNTLTQTEVFYPVKETSPPPVQAIPSPKKDVPVLTEIPFPIQNSSQRKDFKIPQGKTLPLGEKVVVYITFIHSIGCFCVQLEDSPIEAIVEGLAQIYQEPVPLESDLTKGKFVAAMYSSDDSWSRAEILSESPENSVITVLYVDFGNDEKCKSCNTRWLSEKLSTYPVQAIYCSLYGIQPLQGEDDWSKDAWTKFGDIVKEEALVAITQSYTDDGICEVDLYLKNDSEISINQKLIELGLVRALEEIVIEDSISEAESDLEPEPLKLPEENEWDVYISFINQSSKSVVLRLVGENYSEKLDEFDNELEKSYQSCMAVCSVEEDGLYIALIDELYHRVRVLSILDDTTIECYFLDHGDTERVNKDQLKSLDPTVNKLLPYQAIEVSLYGLEEIATNPTTVDKLLDLALAKTCVAEIISRDEGLSVILYDTGNDEDVNINEVIATAVMEETEARMMAVGDFQPASISTETSPVKGLSSKSKNLEQALNSLKISQEKKATSDINEEEEGEEENGDSEGSWETEEEEEVVPVKGAMKKVKDKNSNMVKISTKKNVTTSDELSNVQKSKSQSPDSEGKNLYTWKKSGQRGEASGVDVDDEMSLWVHEEYWKRPLPQPMNIPERGDYIDCHVSKVFDPTNFVCIPYGSMADLDQLLKDCIEYFNLHCIDRILQQKEIKVGHLYAGHQGGAWYRVLINKRVGPGLVSVYIVDFGEYNAMTVEEIKPLPWRFWKLPFQAFKCKLHGIKPVKGTQVWSEGAKLKMKQMAEEKDLVGLVCGKEENGVVSLRLVDTATEKDVCLDETLLDLEMAQIIEPTS
ncbi:tudor domain-containing protein 7B-like isoform X29 [Mytilus californianus]|uniref:tudor domain-containing protein 7B-like isoform X29 n=1 Tax=Mytilus californianus TaxID=6549 RepID=UPI0022454DF0|nr:tudor domain-containing protein 7B-like isoform X29 [Mytilus californianus]